MSSTTQFETDSLDRELTNAIKALWADEGVQSVFGRSQELHLNDSAGYYFDQIDRIGAASYVPSDEDILRSRVRSTGIQQANFVVNGSIFRV